MNFLKKYWTHFICLLYFLLTIFLAYNVSKFDDMNKVFVIAFVSITIIFTLTISISMIYFIVHSLKSDNKNKVINAILLYLLNVYYIPCYYLKNVMKDEKYKNKNIAYIIITIILTIIMFLSILTIPKIDFSEYSYETYSINNVKFDVSTFYKEEVNENYDYYFGNKKGEVALIYFENSDSTSYDILKEYEDVIKEVFNVNPKLYKNYNTDDSNIRTAAFLDNDDNSVYYISVITLNDKPNDYIYVFQDCYNKSYDIFEEQFLKLLDSFRIDDSTNNQQ